jgi:Na+/H+-dicarboxylate symporter/ABC-type amino acid transport substrate-binding protein
VWSAVFIFGEYCAHLKVLGDAFIKLMQMTILPYIVVSLIYGIGRLDVRQAKTLATRAGVFLLLLWGVGLLIILSMPAAFPQWETASFFSTSLVETPTPVDLLDLYLPSNPVRSMADNMIPAVVLFSIAVGLALMGIRDKERLIHPLEILSASLTRVAGHAVKAAPIGVFALAANAAGTMTLAELGRLQVYFVTYFVAAGLLAFWVLPMLVAACTPLRYREVVGVSRDALVTAFATGNLFVILPILAEGCKRLLKEHGLGGEDSASFVDVILPIAFSFPNVGKLLALLFVPFGAWFTGDPLSFWDYPVFGVSGLLSFFSGVSMAIPFLLDSWRVPIDLFELFMITALVNGRVSAVVAGMHLLAYVLLATCAVKGGLLINWRRLAGIGVCTLILTGGSLVGARLFLSRAVSEAYDQDQVIARMRLLEKPVPAVVHRSVPDAPGVSRSSGSRLEQIRKRGVLRVGYNPERLPFSFFNQNGELVGFDVDMAHRLAGDLRVTLEFIPVTYGTLVDQLRQDQFDLVMSGVAVTEWQLDRIWFSEPYLDVSLALVVKDHRREEFASKNTIEQMKGVRLGVVEGGYFAAKLQERFPQAQIVIFESIREYFEDDSKRADALLLSAEGGSAWCLLYPQYQVVVPRPRVAKQPLAYVVAGDDREFLDLVNHWIRIKRKRGVIQELHDYWILGQGAQKKQPRWSVIRDVLGWVE